MPNHVQNIVNFNCPPERIKEILTGIQADDPEEQEYIGLGTIDFQKIIPMPESLLIESGSRTTEGVNLYLTSINPNVTYYGDADKKISEEELLPLVFKIKQSRGIGSYEPFLPPDEIEKIISTHSEAELLELGKNAVENVISYGCTTWYEWRIVNWGTKWNSYSNSYNEDTSEIGFQTAWSAPHPIIAKLAQMFPDVTISHQWADEDMGSNCGKRVYLADAIIEEDIPEGKTALEFAAEVWDTDLADIGLLLNASGSDYVSVDSEEYELITVGDKYALFSNGRITMSDIPRGLYCYDLRQDDSGEYLATVERHVAVNHGGSIIIDQPLDFEGKDHIALNEDNTLNFIGEQMDIGDYMAKKYEHHSVDYEAFKQEISAIERDAGLLSVHHSPDFQCDQTNGFPTSLCWADGKAWLELNRSLIEDGEDVSEYEQLCANFGIRDCETVDDFNSILKELGRDAVESATVYQSEDEGMSMC